MTKEGLSIFERKRFVKRAYRLAFPALPAAFSGFRFAFLTDLHARNLKGGNETLVEAILEEKPDAVFLGGDMLLVKPRKKMDFTALETILSGLQGKVPVYYGEGNHEKRMKEKTGAYPGWWEAFRALLEEYGVTYLDNESVSMKRGADEIRICGLGLPARQYKHGGKKPLDPDYIAGKLGKQQGFTVLLMHSPAFFEEACAWGADLTLAGHYHGGTVYLGKLGGLMTPQFVFFEKRVRGEFHSGGRTMIVGAGLGTHSVNLRVFNPPELVIGELVQEK